MVNNFIIFTNNKCFEWYCVCYNIYIYIIFYKNKNKIFKNLINSNFI